MSKTLNFHNFFRLRIILKQIVLTIRPKHAKKMTTCPPSKESQKKYLFYVLLLLYLYLLLIVCK